MRSFIILAVLILSSLAIGCKGLAYRNPTNNMLPTITPNDVAITNPTYYASNPVERFDIVVFKAPDFAKTITRETGDVRYLKRVIGLPNEKIEIRDNKIYIDDQLLEEPFDRLTNERDSMKNFPALKIPEDEYFLLGDNRPESMDSRHWKPSTIKKQDIYSKIVDIQKDFYKDH